MIELPVTRSASVFNETSKSKVFLSAIEFILANWEYFLAGFYMAEKLIKGLVDCSSPYTPMIWQNGCNDVLSLRDTG